jgi:phosphoribosyl 1,2-cyclic phosphate phosphodiesterase
LLPEQLNHGLRDIRTVYGSVVHFYEEQGFVQCMPFPDRVEVGKIQITAISVDRDSQLSFIYIFEKEGKRMVYAPCDIKPFPEEREEVQRADLLVIQPGIFEDGLKHGFKYPKDHISRTTLYTFEETLALAQRVKAGRILFIHLEEYWNRGHDQYVEIEGKYNNVQFAYDGMRVSI